MSRDWQKDMTREEILAMDPGRELNIVVAENVFELQGLHLMNEFLPDYSGSISAAWEVVEKMRTNKIYLDIRVWPDEYQVLPHQDENNKLIDRWIVKSPSLPESICKAALLSVLEGINLPGEETTEWVRSY